MAKWTSTRFLQSHHGSHLNSHFHLYSERRTCCPSHPVTYNDPKSSFKVTCDTSQNAWYLKNHMTLDSYCYSRRLFKTSVGAQLSLSFSSLPSQASLFPLSSPFPLTLFPPFPWQKQGWVIVIQQILQPFFGGGGSFVVPTPQSWVYRITPIWEGHRWIRDAPKIIWISIMLLHFKTRAPQRRLRPKVTAGVKNQCQISHFLTPCKDYGRGRRKVLVNFSSSN